MNTATNEKLTVDHPVDHPDSAVSAADKRELLIMETLHALAGYVCRNAPSGDPCFRSLIELQPHLNTAFKDALHIVEAAHPVAEPKPAVEQNATPVTPIAPPPPVPVPVPHVPVPPVPPVPPAAEWKSPVPTPAADPKK